MALQCIRPLLLTRPELSTRNLKKELGLPHGLAQMQRILRERDLSRPRRTLDPVYELDMARMQFDIWASTDSGAEAIWDALRGELHTMQNTSIGSGGDATTIELITLDNTTDAVDWPRDASDVHVYNISTDAVIWHRVTVPTFS